MNELHNLQDKIDYIFENNDAMYSLVEILVKEEEETDTKVEIVQLLAALCAYPGGLALVLKALEIWKDKKGDRYRCVPLVNEISDRRSIKDYPTYATTLTILVNCMLAGCDSVEERVRLRNELFGLQLQATLDEFRMVPALCDHQELQKQLDTFDERKMSDDAQMSGPEGVDLNNHADIFDSIMKQVSQKPHEILFLNILQHLLQIDARDNSADLAWEAAEKLVCRAKLISSKEDSDKLLRNHTLPVDNNSASSRCCQCQCGAGNNAVNGNTFANAIAQAASKKLKSHENSVAKSNNVDNAAVTGAPPPPPLGGPPPPVPPPLPPALFNFRKLPQAPPPTVAPTDAADLIAGSKLVDLPLPKHKLKTFAWNKLPLGKIAGNADNLWSKAAKRNFDSYSLDFDSLDTLFCQNSPGSSASTLERKNSAINTNGAVGGGSATKKRENNEINLLDSKRSLNVNIFLRQFKGEIQDLVELITVGDGTKIGMEKLRSLIKLMPESDEIETLTQFMEDKNKLGTAEKFFLALISVDNYQLRVECMLLKEEFATIIDYIRPSLQAIISASYELKNNRSLHDVMYLVLMVGNYLNSVKRDFFGGYGGNAAGFKMTSLWKLMEIRANKPNMTLLHYVVMETDKNNPSLLTFPNHMKHLEEASKLSIDTIISDFRSLKEKTERITRQLLPNICLDVKNQMSEFLDIANRDLLSVQKKLDDMERLRFDLATFFCEDPHGFKLEDCFKIFHHFCVRFNKAMDENNTRKLQEEKVEMRRKLKEQQNASRDLSPYDNGSSPFVRNSYERRSLNTSRSHELLDVLNRSRDSLDADDNGGDLITNSKVRRSLRRRVSAMNDMMSANDRERPVVTSSARPWRQRLEELMAEDSSSGSDQHKSKHRFSLNLNTVVDDDGQSKQDAESSASSVECSAIYAKTFAPPSSRVETARISSVSDVRRPAVLLTPDESPHVTSTPTTSPLVVGSRNEPSKATWRIDRDKRSQSLFTAGMTSQNGSCAEDLNELLQTLETEKKQHDRMIIGRRYSRNSYRGNENDESQQEVNGTSAYHRSWSSNNTPNQDTVSSSTSDLNRKFSAGDNDNATPGHYLRSNPSLIMTPSSPTVLNVTTGDKKPATVVETDKNGFGRSRRGDKISEEIPDYSPYATTSTEESFENDFNGNHVTIVDSARSSIDEVVRHVERTREEIEKFALTLDSEKSVVADSDLDLRSSNFTTSATTFGRLSREISRRNLMDEDTEIVDELTECEPSTTECMVDFSLPSGYDEPTATVIETVGLEISPEQSSSFHLPIGQFGRENASSNNSNNLWLNHNRSPRSPEDQSDARSTESPTESVADRDEGFETESTNTVCNEQTLSNTKLADATKTTSTSRLIDTTRAVIDRSRIRPNFVAKSASTRNVSSNNNNNSIDKQTAPRPKMAPVKGQSFLKRTTDFAMSKNTQTALTTRSQSQAVGGLSKLPASSRAVLSRSSTNASSMSSGSSRDERRPLAATNSNSASSIAKKLPPAMKPTRNPLAKQKQIQIRSRVEALKEAASSSDSERTNGSLLVSTVSLPQQQKQGVAPKPVSKSLKLPVGGSPSQTRKSSLPSNEKTLQRLLSPPKQRLSRPSSAASVSVKNDPNNNSGACKSSMQQNGNAASASFRNLQTNGNGGLSAKKPVAISASIKVPNGRLTNGQNGSGQLTKRAASLEPAHVSKTASKNSWR